MQSSAQEAFFFFHWDCRLCRCSPKIMFYLISHNNILIVFETLWDVEKTCFSQLTGGTAGAIFNVLDCESRDPVLVENRSKIVFTVILYM